MFKYAGCRGEEGHGANRWGVVVRATNLLSLQDVKNGMLGVGIGHHKVGDIWISYCIGGAELENDQGDLNKGAWFWVV